MNTLKFIHNNNIHKLSQVPKTFSSLQESLNLLLKDSLPRSYFLQYEDTEGDRVMLSGEEDYKAMLLTELPQDASKSVRVFIVPKGENIPKSTEMGTSGKAETEGNKSIRKSTEEENLFRGGDDDEDDDKSHDDLESMGDSKRSNVGEDEKGDWKNQKKMMKREIKMQRIAKKTEFLKDAITDAFYDNLPNMAKVIKAYVDDPTINLEETVQNIRPKRSAPCDMGPDVFMHLKKPMMMFKAMKECYKGLTDDQKANINKLLGGIPEKMMAKSKEREEEFGKEFGRDKEPVWARKFRHAWHPEHFKKDEQEPPRWKGEGGRGGFKRKEKYENREENYQEGWKPREKEYPRKQKEESYGYGGDYGYDDGRKGKGKYGKKEESNAGKNANIGPEYNIEFVKEVGSVPSRVTINDGVIYKTVSVRNSGMTEWPRSTLLMPRGEVRGEVVRLTNVKPGQEFSPVLMLKNPGKTGDFMTEWKLAYKDEQGKTIYAGPSVKVGLTVYGEGKSGEGDKKGNERKIDDKVMKKAEELKKIFPQADFDFIIEVVSQAPDLSLQELAENF